jgi:hypothetical protein
MANDHTLAPTPLTFELPRALVDRIHACRARLGLKSASEVVRRALEHFNFGSFKAPRREQCQISVRLSPDQKRVLFFHARRQKVSAGVLLRSALEALALRPTVVARQQRPLAGAAPKAALRKAAAKVSGKRPARSKRR